MERLTLPQGMLERLILKAREPLHGWALSERLQQAARDALRLGQRTLYPAQTRTRETDKASRGTTDANQRAEYYELAHKGSARLEAATNSWRRRVDAVGHALDLA